MSLTPTELPDKFKSWKEYNKNRKEQQKVWKKEKLIKQIKRDNVTCVLKTSVDEDEKKLSTVSIAVPGSILDNAQSLELRTYLAGQIARAACVFNVDEIVVFDDYDCNGPTATKLSKIETNDGLQTARHCCVQLARILQYLECPQYLRKHFFPIHNDLTFCGLLNPLDAPHHLRQQNTFCFREGIVTNKSVKENRMGSYVNIGLLNDAYVDTPLTPGLRVTVKLENNIDLKSKKIKGIVVAPSRPRQETGVYWGYNVRLANSLSKIFTQSPYENGYDLIIGTSDKGKSINDVTNDSLKFYHTIIVFGGLEGLEGALENDNALEVDNLEHLFDEYLNTVPNQGSRTIRTEEAILITLSCISSKLSPREKAKIFNLKEHIPHSGDT